jgi:phosphoribosylformylglycinamidine cyclo-ligase
MTDYKKSGVDIQAGDLWTSTLARLTAGGASREMRERLLSGIGDYAATYKLSDDLALALSCDGVGTKLLWTLDGLGSYADLAKDLLAMNVNDLLCVGATPLLFLDYLAVSSKKLIAGESAPLGKFIEGLNQHCSDIGMLLVGGETAQMPDLYEEGHFDLAGFAVGTLRPDDRLGPHRLAAGAKIWGWTSSGPHSNGFSYLRKIFDATKDAPVIREHFMPGTRLYVNVMKALKNLLAVKARPSDLQAAFHVTGSGLLNLIRYDAPFAFDLSAWPKTSPAWFKAIEKRSELSRLELHKTFNGGFGMLVVVDANSAISRQDLEALGLQELGTVRSLASDKTPHVLFEGIAFSE